MYSKYQTFAVIIVEELEKMLVGSWRIMQVYKKKINHILIKMTIVIADVKDYSYLRKKKCFISLANVSTYIL